MAIFLYVIIGLIAGFLGGLLGIGGGLITVPCLLLVFRLYDFPPLYLMHLAIGTSLAAMVFSAGVSTWTHAKKKGVSWNLFFRLSGGIILGTFLGAALAEHLQSHTLQLVFAGFELVIGLYFLFFSLKERHEHSQVFSSIPLWTALGLCIGTLSSLLGIGGGIVTVPILSHLGSPMKNAIATSAATGFLIALIGAVSFLTVGLKHSIVEHSVGYLYLPAFIAMGIASCLIAPLGAKLAYTLPTSLLKQLFGALLCIAGISMGY